MATNNTQDDLNSMLASMQLGTVDSSGRGIPPGALTPKDLNRVVVSFVNETIRVVRSERPASIAVGIKLRTLYDTLAKHCNGIVQEGQWLLAFATYNIFYSWWHKTFLKAETMPQFGRDVRNIRGRIKGYKINKAVCENC